MINYVEPVSIGGLFVGLGSLVVACTVAYIFYRVYIKFAQWLDVIINREAKYELLEESFLDNIAANKGVNLEKELLKRKMFDKQKKSFRKRLEEKIYEEMFGNEKKPKK
jgi:hypothetical protein